MYKIKIILSIFVSVIISSISFAQEVLNQKDSLGNKQGEWVEFFNSPKVLKYKMTYIDNLLDGKFYCYNKKQHLIEIRYYSKGHYLMYKTLRRTKDGKKDEVYKIHGCRIKESKSPLKYIYDRSQYFSDSINYTDSLGLMQGVWSHVTVRVIMPGSYWEYYCIGLYKNSKKTGIWKYYRYDERYLEFEIEYEDDLYNGPLKIYSDEGVCVNTYYYSKGNLK